MKKLLSLLFVFTLVACGGSDDDDTADEEQLFLDRYDGTSWIIRNIRQPSGAVDGEIIWDIGRQFEIHSGDIFLTNGDCYSKVGRKSRISIVSHTESEFVWDEPYNDYQQERSGLERGRSSLYIENGQLVFNCAYAFVEENQLLHIMDRVGTVDCNPI